MIPPRGGTVGIIQTPRRTSSLVWLVDPSKVGTMYRIPDCCLPLVQRRQMTPMGRTILQHRKTAGLILQIAIMTSKSLPPPT